MYYQLILQCVEGLKGADRWLDKAEEYASVKRFDVSVLMNARLAPDMGGFIYQIQSACDYVKGGVAWLSGTDLPRHEDTEQTISDVRARLRKTIAFAASVSEQRFAEASERQVRLSWKVGKVLVGADYLAQMVIPNVFFHLSMAYAILRANGLDIGKMDFLGPLNFVDDPALSSNA
jgi:hypothetical protein